MSESDPTKRVPKSLRTDTQLFGRYTLTDIGVALAPGVAVVLVLQVAVPASVEVAGYGVRALALPLAALGITVGALFVTLTPEYVSSAGWLGHVVGFYAGDRTHDHHAAREHTLIDQIHPDHDALERTDGAIVGLVRVEPPTMALATDAEWERKADQFRTFCNTTLAFPVQLYATTQPFPVEEYLAHYEDRLTDTDISENPQLSKLVEAYIAWYRDELQARQMTIRNHYVVVPVRPAEVQFDQGSLAGRLADLLVVGPLVRLWRAPERPVERAAQLDELDERLRRVTAGLREIDGCEAHRVDATAATRVVAEFWAGSQREYDDPERTLRTRPLVARDTPGGGT